MVPVVICNLFEDASQIERLGKKYNHNLYSYISLKHIPPIHLTINISISMLLKGLPPTKVFAPTHSKQDVQGSNPRLVYHC